ncbi:hypothetical protein [Pseudoruegeria aquimaris]|uniref:hypothetical protein n=1 Tax=Pseudoruegeria aquimaris TaxID=393663 RepID=UPI001FE4F11D|nr:hypothetical protein [Pseudoruegeria aquimaris]
MSDGAFAFARANARWIGAGALMALCSGFGQTYFISIFAGNIRADFSLSHGSWGAIYAGSTLASAAVMLWAGGLACGGWAASFFWGLLFPASPWAWPRRSGCCRS